MEDRAYTDIHHIFEQTLKPTAPSWKAKTSACASSAAGKQAFNSQDVERYVGGGLNQHIESAR